MKCYRLYVGPFTNRYADLLRQFLNLQSLQGTEHLYVLLPGEDIYAACNWLNDQLRAAGCIWRIQVLDLQNSSGIAYSAWAAKELV